MLRSFALAVALVCLLPGLAAAEDDFARPGWYLGLGGTYAFHVFPDSFDGDIGISTKTHNSFGINTRGGYRINSWAAAELEFEWIDAFNVDGGFNTNFDLTYYTITANGKFIYPGWGRFQPYALAGIGTSIITTDSRSGLGSGLESSTAGFTGRIGAGLDTYLTENWLLNLGVEIVMPTNSIGNSIGGDLDQLFYVPLQFGVQYRF